MTTDHDVVCASTFRFTGKTRLPRIQPGGGTAAVGSKQDRGRRRNTHLGAITAASAILELSSTGTSIRKVGVSGQTGRHERVHA